MWVWSRNAKQRTDVEYNLKEDLKEWKDMRMRESANYDYVKTYNVENKDQYLWKRPYKLFLEFVCKYLGLKHYLRIHNLSFLQKNIYI